MPVAIIEIPGCVLFANSSQLSANQVWNPYSPNSTHLRTIVDKTAIVSGGFNRIGYEVLQFILVTVDRLTEQHAYDGSRPDTKVHITRRYGQPFVYVPGPQGL